MVGLVFVSVVFLLESVPGEIRDNAFVSPDSIRRHRRELAVLIPKSISGGLSWCMLACTLILCLNLLFCVFYGGCRLRWSCLLSS
ncbi:Os01g0553600 [Oryza sativa Japonica Group]|uniref:Os01g0553600 protein n=1 Tax=Oryza sativa subsp. japonica TaxID=39947 RepID=C7IWR1_ORYSJ|nr:Os01g0553600 [Oryza sativa Japonica Group]|eukprot:NP_001172415.1 Os01g0553600 [Oryza sativa Japonica Group]